MAMRLPSEPKESVPYLRGYYDAKADYEVKHGRWVYGNDFHWYTANCSLCGYRRSTDIKTSERWNGWRYCPNCGAKMDEVTE